MRKIFVRRRNAFIAGSFCGLLLLCACATTLPTEDIIEKRAMQRWTVLLNEDIAAAYEFLSPGYRSSVSAIQYQRALLLNQVKWTGASYVGSECTETTCKVKILLNFTLYGGLPGVKSFDGSDVIEESWIQSDNEWYLVPKR